jgi:mono/diheme cytochrome c family protein
MEVIDTAAIKTGGPQNNEKIKVVMAVKILNMKRLSALAVASSILLTPMTNPAASSKAAEAAGATLFRDKGCAYCHGSALQGTPKAPSLEYIRKTWKAPQITDQIENGGQKMPSFKDALSNDEVINLVAYLRAKHRPQAAPLPPKPQISAPVSNPEQ